MRKYLHFILLLFFIPTLASCAADAVTQEKVFKTEEEAIQYGADHDGVEVLTQVKYQDETIVLITRSKDLVGAASISSKKGGFAWYRSAPFFNIDTKVSLEYETESGKVIPMVIGKVSRDTKRVRVVDNNVDIELDVYQGYFIGFGISAGHNLKIIPIV